MNGFITISFLFLLIFIMPGDCSKIPVKGYKLVWNDEFSGKKLDHGKWNYRGLGKRDDAYITKNAISLDGKGHLIIEASLKGDSIETGMISTENTYHVKYGYLECRAKLMPVKGTMPAFWLQSPRINNPAGVPALDGAEIDIFEYFPHLNKQYVYHSLHWGGYGNTHKTAGPVLGLLDRTADGFHTIGLEWTKNSYTTYVDGKKTYSGDTLISQIPEFIILSLGINSIAAGPLDTASLPCRFVVDYIRVYKK